MRHAAPLARNRSLAVDNESILPKAVEVAERQDVAAGNFSSWLRTTRRALVDQGDVDVPCGGCNACCRSSYFIHIRPEETETLARIPEEFLFAAPGQPQGHMLMGYDEKGHCPMLVDDECSIYEYRPSTCRNYDCRIFSAAGITAGEDDKDRVFLRASHWRFEYRDESERQEHAALQSATAFLAEHDECFPSEVGNNSTRLAIFAVKVYQVFLRIHDRYTRTGLLPAEAEVVELTVDACREFDESGEKEQS